MAGALALGAGLLALPGAALAQDDHHGDRASHQAPPARPAPPPAPAPRAFAPPPAPMAHGGGQPMERGGGQPMAHGGDRPMERGGGQPMAHGGDQPTERGGGQWNGEHRPGNPAGNGWQGRPQPGYAQGQGQPQYRGQPPYQGRPEFQGHQYQGQPQYQGQWRGNDGGPGRNDGQWHGGGGERGGEWSHNWRQDHHYDWRGYREENRDAFHVGRYYAPYRDYAYNRLGVGFYLQPLFFGQDYWIADPWDYRLPPAYGPYHWVRYYNDVLLVNTYTGQVADVIYDFFW